MPLDEQIDAHIESDVRNAIRALANAAATERAGRPLRAGPAKDRAYLTFLVRALCQEHGMDVRGVMERAENIARGRIERELPQDP